MASTSNEQSPRQISPCRRHPAVVLLACGSFNPPTFMHLRMFELARDHLHRKTNYRVIEGVVSVVNDAYTKKDLVSAEHRLAMVRLALENSKWIRLDEWEAKQTQWCPTLNVLRHVRSMVRQRLFVNQEKPKASSFTADDGERLDVGPAPLKKSKMEVPTAQSSTESSGVGSTVSDHKASSSMIVSKAASIDVPSAAALSTADTDEQPLRVMLLCGSDLLQSFEVPNLWATEDIEEIVRDFGIVVVTRAGYDSQKFVYESDLLSRYEGNIHFVTEWIANDVSSTKIRRALKRAESVRYLVPDKVLDYIYRHRLYGCSRRLLDILSSPSLILDTGSEPTTSARMQKDGHCSYHPQYKKMQRRNEESDYDNLAPCPCPLSTSASTPNATAVQLVRTPRPTTSSTRATSVERVQSLSITDKAISLDAADQANGKLIRFPTDADPTTKGPTSINGGPARPTLKLPTVSPRAVSYHCDLSRSTASSLPSSRTMDLGDTSRLTEQMTFGSVSGQQRSMSNLSEIQERNPLEEFAKNGEPILETEEATWQYNPELTKSMPNLRIQRQTPPRHVRIMDKGVCFSHGETTTRVEEVDLANNLVVKVKHLKLTMSPETTV